MPTRSRSSARRRAFTVASLALGLAFVAPGLTHAQLGATKLDLPAPGELAAPIRSLLTPAAKVTAGAATIEVWVVSALPGTGTDWSGVAEGAIVGAMRIAGPFKEIRGKTVKPGVYTLRFGLQPQNGDHLGASPFREYLLLSPAAVDTDATPLGFEGTVALSKQTLGASHPAALSLDPPVATGAALSIVTNELEHKGIVLEVTTAAGPRRFGLILIGVIEH